VQRKPPDWARSGFFSAGTLDAAWGAQGFALVAELPPRRRVSCEPTLFGGDIGVLLAQLEQQFQTVSHAIQTVKNLVETVNRLGNIVQNSKTLLEHAKNGGVMGVIDAAQGFVNIGQGVIGRLRLTNNDANWWISKITPLVADKDYQMSSADRAALDSQLPRTTGSGSKAPRKSTLGTTGSRKNTSRCRTVARPPGRR
jgi:hypothetical protein